MLFHFVLKMTTLDNDLSADGGPPAKQAKTETEENETKKTETVGKLRTEAVSRKERLIALRKQAHNEGIASTPSTRLNSGDGMELPKPIFRNYKPISDTLLDGELPQSTMVDRRFSSMSLFENFLYNGWLSGLTRPVMPLSPSLFIRIPYNQAI